MNRTETVYNHSFVYTREFATEFFRTKAGYNPQEQLEIAWKRPAVWKCGGGRAREFLRPPPRRATIPFEFRSAIAAR